LTFENWASDDQVILELNAIRSIVTGTGVSDRIQGFSFNSIIDAGGGDDVFALQPVQGGTIDGGDGWDKFVVTTNTIDLAFSTISNFEEVVFETDSLFQLTADSFWNGFGGTAPVFSGVADHAVTITVIL
jgi:hypothetical protein